MNKEDLLLTPEQILQIIYKHVNNSHGMVAQAQLSNVLKKLTEEKDKPDDEGLWFMTREFGSEINLCDIWRYKGRLECRHFGEILPNGSVFLIHSDGVRSVPIIDRSFADCKWVKAFVPQELKEMME